MCTVPQILVCLGLASSLAEIRFGWLDPGNRFGRSVHGSNIWIDLLQWHLILNQWLVASHIPTVESANVPAISSPDTWYGVTHDSHGSSSQTPSAVLEGLPIHWLINMARTWATQSYPNHTWQKIPMFTHYIILYHHVCWLNPHRNPVKSPPKPPQFSPAVMALDGPRPQRVSGHKLLDTSQWGNMP